ncbi:MAG: extracellular solute-binding protein [Anaerolineae bacterium]|nr:MAG: extracellular solute-binding protein [Anaerolineae bacterium]
MAASPSPTATATPGVPSSPATPPSPLTLTLWLPPQFDPAADTSAGALLQARLDEFASRRPGVQIAVRIKDVTGPANLLDALIATGKAAPAALPDLIALPREDLETAALKGALRPLDGLTDLLDDPDWYAYARQLGHVQNTAFGLPFAGDALVLLYRPESVGTPPRDWSLLSGVEQRVQTPEGEEQTVRLLLPAADPQALFSLCLYLSANGPLTEEQGILSLDEQTLARTLAFYRQAWDDGALPPAVLQYQTDEQVWEAFRAGEGDLAVTWLSHYLQEMPEGIAVLPLPGLDGDTYTLATGWAWGLAGADAEVRPQAVELLEFLMDGEFLGQWNAASGYLPTRPSAMEAHPDETLTEIAASAQPLPPHDVILKVGPVMQEALLSVLNGEAEPEEAAQTALDALK